MAASQYIKKEGPSGAFMPTEEAVRKKETVVSTPHLKHFLIVLEVDSKMWSKQNRTNANINPAVLFVFSYFGDCEVFLEKFNYCLLHNSFI